MYMHFRGYIVDTYVQILLESVKKISHSIAGNSVEYKFVYCN